ncbi:MAG: molybdate ABC transporter permease subunit [Salibacteraceae bacterium]
MDLQPIYLSLQLAALATGLLLLLGVPLAYLLTQPRSWIRPFFEAIINLPLVLPPTVLGFYFLVAFGNGTALGRWLQEVVGLQLLFSFQGLVLASVLYSLPFMVNPVYAALRALPDSLKEAAYVLGYSKWKTFRKVLLPNIRPALLTGSVFAFAHVLGEFGLVLMIGGNLPGETRLASIAIYDQVEVLNYAGANQYAMVLLGLSLGILLLAFTVNRKAPRVL